MHDLDPRLGRLDAWLATHRAAYAAKLAPGAGDDAIAALTARAPGALPASLLAMLRWHDGQLRSGSLVQNWMWMSCAGIVEAMDVLDDLLDAGEFASEDWWRRSWVPFAESGSGDHLCVDLGGAFGGAAGQIVEFCHDAPTRSIRHGSFDAWLETLIAACEHDLLVDDEYGLQPRDDAQYAAFVAERNPGFPVDGSA